MNFILRSLHGDRRLLAAAVVIGFGLCCALDASAAEDNNAVGKNLVEKPDDQGSPWQKHIVFDDDRAQVRLLVRRQASLADEEWLALEFENKSGTALDLKHVAVYGNHLRRDRTTGKGLISGNFLSVQGAVFSERRLPPSKDSILDPRQTYRCVTMLSDGCSAGLGVPRQAGYRVDVKLTFQIRGLYEGDRQIDFTFDWLYPDDDGMKRAEARLRRLISTPKLLTGSDSLIAELLKIQRLRDAVGLEGILKAIEARHFEPQAMRRESLLKLITAHYPRDDRVVEFYRAKLATDPQPVTYDLLKLPTVWKGDFVGPLVKLFESDPYRYRYLLRLLDRNAIDWAHDAAVRNRIFTSVRSIYKEIPDDPRQATEWKLDQWLLQADLLRETHDPRAIDIIKLGLEDRRKQFEDDKPPRPGFGFGVARPSPQRVCDIAMETLLLVLDGDTETAYQSTDLAHDKLDIAKPISPAAAAKVRDAMIVALKERLAAPEKAKK